MPKYFWLEKQSYYSLESKIQRYIALNFTIKRRLNTTFDIPQIWQEERADLLIEIQKEKQWAYDPCNITKNAFRFLITTCYKFVIYLEDLERYIT